MSLVSICIPTLNRSEYLDFLLGEIAKFQELNYEVVISDNNSQDDTSTVVLRWRSELKRLYYIRQSETLTGPQNACAVCNAARGDYIFRISDDDLVIEEGLIAAQKILDADTRNIAVYPRWHICNSDFTELQTVVHYGSAEPLIRNNTDRLEDATAHDPIEVTQDQALEMYERFWTVELPVFRRDIFQRHIGNVSDQLPLDFHAAAQFLNHGRLFFIWELCAQIRQHPEQDSAALHSPRVLEAYMSDYEQFLALVPNLDPLDAMKSFYGKMLRQYIIACQFAVQVGDFLRAVEIVRKASAYKIPGIAEFAAEFEKTHHLNIVTDHLYRIISSASRVDRVLMEDSLNTRSIIPLLQKKLSHIPIELLDSNAFATVAVSPRDFILATTWEGVEVIQETPGANPAHCRAIDDIMRSCQVN